MDNETHVVVTRYFKARSNRIIIHAYGPYTFSKATNERRKLLKEYDEAFTNGTLLVSVCKMLREDRF